MERSPTKREIREELRVMRFKNWMGLVDTAAQAIQELGWKCNCKGCNGRAFNITNDGKGIPGILRCPKAYKEEEEEVEDETRD